MRIGSLAFLLGVVALLRLPSWPQASLFWALAALLTLSLYLGRPARPWLGWMAWALAGFLYAALRTAPLLNDVLPIEVAGRDAWLTGEISGVVDERGGRQRFQIAARTLHVDGRGWQVPAKVRLSWHRSEQRPAPGESWRLKVRLRRPHGFANPGGFDYEGWLFQRGVRAVGYVRAHPGNARLARAQGISLHGLRQGLGKRLLGVAHEGRFAGILSALSLGLRQGMETEQWRVLRRTGTTHLMAISGLHIGLVATLAFFLAHIAWARAGRAPLWLAAPRAAALAAILAALGYAALAGFSIPTQRALLMVLVFMGSLLFRRNIAPSRSLALALLLVLLLDPLSVLANGFWLSFTAVAVILLGTAGHRLGRGLWQRWGRVQWLVAVGLLPLTLLFFQQNALVAPLANLIAVPWMGWVVVPLALAGTLLLSIWPWLAGWLLSGAELGLALLWPLLEGLAQLPLVVHRPGLPAWVWGSAIIGSVVLLLPRGLPARWLGLLWLAPVFIYPLERPAPGQVDLSLLDVGQGLASVLITREHTLVYDTGARFSADFDAGRAVLLPFLRNRGVSRIDTLVVSHSDNDHIGGAASLLAEMPAHRVLSSVPGSPPGARSCRAGQAWQWDGVSFRILHPPVDAAGSENDRSCVLHVRAGAESLLLTGDIERRGEMELLKRHPGALASTIMSVPHHGSSSSSTEAFLDAVAPQLALVPAGYRNRWGFPRPDVLARYRERGIRVLISGREGAVSLRLGTGDAFSPARYRLENPRLWRGQPDAGER